MEHSLKLFDDRNNLTFSIEDTHEEKLLDLELEQDIYVLESYINTLTDAEKSLEMLTTMENMSLCDNVTDESLVLSFEASLGLVGLKGKARNINRRNIKRKAVEYKDKIKDKIKAVVKATINFITRMSNTTERKHSKLITANKYFNSKKSLEKLKDDEGKMTSYVMGGTIGDVLKNMKSLGDLKDKPFKVKTGFNDIKVTDEDEVMYPVYSTREKIQFNKITSEDLSFYLDVGTSKYFDYVIKVKELGKELERENDTGGNLPSLIMHKVILSDLTNMINISHTLAKKLDYSKEPIVTTRHGTLHGGTKSN